MEEFELKGQKVYQIQHFDIYGLPEYTYMCNGKKYMSAHYLWMDLAPEEQMGKYNAAQLRKAMK